MLKFFRNKDNQKRIYVVLALIIIPSFLITGVVLFGPGEEQGSTVLGRIGTRKVGLQEYLGSYRAVRNHAAMMYGRDFAKVQNRINFKTEAWDRLLLLDYAKKRGIKVSDKEVVQWIQSQTAFQVGGRFSLQAYQAFVAEAMHDSTRKFEEQVRDLIVLRKLAEDVRANLKVGDAELRELYARRHAARDLEYGFVKTDIEAKKAALPDEEVKRLYDIVKEKLTEPERVNVRYVLIPASEADAKKTALLDQSPLEEMAKKYSLTPAETGMFSKNDVVPAFAGALEAAVKSFELGEGQESEWFQTSRGFYKLKVLKKEAERQLSEEESKDTLRGLLARDKAREETVAKLQALRAEAEIKGFEKALSDAKIEMRMFPGWKAGTALPDVGAAPALEPALADLKAGEVSPALETSEGALLVKVVKDGPVDDAAFEQEKNAFREKAVDELIDKKMDALLNDLRKDLKVDLQTMQKILPA